MKSSYGTGFSNKSVYSTLFFFLFIGWQLVGQNPEITVRFANPQYDCDKGEYCLDVEFQSDTPGAQLFGMNVRFFYDDDVLELFDFRNYAGGYGPITPNPPLLTTGDASSGSDLFNLTGPAEFVNGAIQLVDDNAAPIVISTTGWTKIFTACFHVVDPNPNVNNFCPSLVWDLEADPANGGFPLGDDGVVITLVNPNPNQGSLPADEAVVQFNWEYSGPGTAPYGNAKANSCISINCGGSSNVGLDISISDLCTSETINGRGPVTVKVTAPVGQNWTIKNVLTLYSTASPPAPGAPTLLTAGTPLAYVGNNMYILNAIRLEGVGYWIQVTNGNKDLDILVGD